MAAPVRRCPPTVLRLGRARHARILGAPLVLGTLIALSGPAHAAPGGERDGPRNAPNDEGASRDDEGAPRQDEGAPREDADEVRLRGGFSLNGGVLFTPDNPHAYGGVIGLAFRLGVQFTDLLALYYQNTPFVTVIVDPQSSVTAGALDYNTVLLGLTFWNVFDLGIGAGADIVGTYVCTPGQSVTLPDGSTTTNLTPDCSRAVRVAPGAHLRLALDLGSGPTPDDPHRSAFALGIDLHPSFVIASGATPVLVTLTAGLGGEWY